MNFWITSRYFYEWRVTQNNAYNVTILTVPTHTWWCSYTVETCSKIWDRKYTMRLKRQYMEIFWELNLLRIKACYTVPLNCSVLLNVLLYLQLPFCFFHYVLSYSFVLLQFEVRMFYFSVIRCSWNRFS
jgi:hypothetical protein